MSEQMERNERDFFSRPQEDQQALLKHTWCPNCMEVDLGMSDPVEYEQKGIVFIEGQCNKCGETITTEITEEDF